MHCNLDATVSGSHHPDHLIKRLQTPAQERIKCGIVYMLSQNQSTPACTNMQQRKRHSGQMQQLKVPTTLGRGSCQENGEGQRGCKRQAGRKANSMQAAGCTSTREHNEIWRVVRAGSTFTFAPPFAQAKPQVTMHRRIIHIVHRSAGHACHWIVIQPMWQGVDDGRETHT